MDKQSFSQCNICLENIFDFNEFVTNCNHCYHLNCIYTWYVYQRRNFQNCLCPVCRSDIQKDYKQIFSSHYSYGFFNIFKTDDHESIVSFIRNYFFDPNIQDINGNTPLLLTVVNKKDNLVKELLTLPSIKPHIVNKKQISPLICAISQNSHSIIHLFKKNKMIPKGLKNLV